MNILKGDFGEFGARVTDSGVVFTFATSGRTESFLHLFNRSDLSLIKKVSIPSDCKIGKVCSVLISDIDYKNTVYLIERDGQLTPDDYASSIVGRQKWNDKKRINSDFLTYSCIDVDEYTWSDQSFKPHEAKDMIMYKLHMRGFTMNHGLDASKKGNYLGLLDRLSEVTDLGVNTIEFFPLYEFEEMNYAKNTVLDDKFIPSIVYEDLNKINYWGYDLASYFAPKASYFGQDPINNMKSMVDKLHNDGIEVVMEMAFLPNSDAGFIKKVLQFWVLNYHIDGFHLLGENLPMSDICKDPYLADTKLFAAEFPYELLSFEKKNKHLFIYNDEFLYSLRQLVNHQDGSMAELANRLKRQNEDFGFVNYAANSNGFTLIDSFSYGEKHNQDNGEDNRDGNNYNASSNYGAEGKTKNRQINNARLRSAKTSMAACLLSQAVPLILSGDECLNSQNGNNNIYCQDNKTGWVDFNTSKSALELREFIKAAIAFRKENPVIHLEEPMHMNDYHHTGIPDMSYHGREPWMMGIGNERKALGVLYAGEYSDDAKKTDDVMICYNFHYGTETFALPKLSKDKTWYQVCNTATGFTKPSLLKNQEVIAVPGGTITVLIGK